MQLPEKIENFLAALAQIFEQGGQRQHEAIIVNAQVRIDTDYRNHTHKNYPGYHGYALYLSVPPTLFVTNRANRTAVCKEICAELNNLHGSKDEWFDEVFMEMAVDHANDWRKKSGVLIGTARAVDEGSTKRIWGENNGYRIFLSHKTEVKKEVAKLKEDLEPWGVSCFVAHADINPTREWQNEIENALASMDGFVALLTENFHDSNWTDQEVGYALARGVPIIAVKLGKDPYGFIGKFQALATDWENAPIEIVKLLINNDRMISAYTKAIENCGSFDRGNTLATILSGINSLTEKQAQEIVAAYNSNGQAQGAYGFNGRNPAYGPGLVEFLNKFQPGWKFSGWVIKRASEIDDDDEIPF